MGIFGSTGIQAELLLAFVALLTISLMFLVGHLLGDLDRYHDELDKCEMNLEEINLREQCYRKNNNNNLIFKIPKTIAIPIKNVKTGLFPVAFGVIAIFVLVCWFIGWITGILFICDDLVRFWWIPIPIFLVTAYFCNEYLDFIAKLFNQFKTIRKKVIKRFNPESEETQEICNLKELELSLLSEWKKFWSIFLFWGFFTIIFFVIGLNEPFLNWLGILSLTIAALVPIICIEASNRGVTLKKAKASTAIVDLIFCLLRRGINKSPEHRQLKSLKKNNPKAEKTHQKRSRDGNPLNGATRPEEEKNNNSNISIISRKNSDISKKLLLTQGLSLIFWILIFLILLTVHGEGGIDLFSYDMIRWCCTIIILLLNFGILFKAYDKTVKNRFPMVSIGLFLGLSLLFFHYFDYDFRKFPQILHIWLILVAFIGFISILEGFRRYFFDIKKKEFERSIKTGKWWIILGSSAVIFSGIIYCVKKYSILLNWLTINYSVEAIILTEMIIFVSFSSFFIYLWSYTRPKA